MSGTVAASCGLRSSLPRFNGAEKGAPLHCKIALSSSGAIGTHPMSLFIRSSPYGSRTKPASPPVRPFSPVMEWQDCRAEMIVDVPCSVAYECYSDREVIPQWMPFISSVKRDGLLAQLWEATETLTRERERSRSLEELERFHAQVASLRAQVESLHEQVREAVDDCSERHKMLVLEDKPDLSRWYLKYEVFGRDIELSWLARNMQPIPNQKIHWRSLEGLPNRGAVRFFQKGPSSCKIELTISYEIPQILAPVASALKPFLEGLLLRGLEQFATVARNYERKIPQH